MPITTDQYERLMKFLDAQMTVQEMADFDEELRHDPDLRSQLDFEQSVRDAFGQQTGLQTTGKLIEIPAGNNGWIHARPWIAAAAVIIVVMAVVSLWPAPKNTPPTAQGKTADTTSRLVNRPAERGDRDLRDSNTIHQAETVFKEFFQRDSIPDQYPVYLAEALIDYEAGDFRTIWNTDADRLPETRGNEPVEASTASSMAHYYKGLAYLETGAVAKAIAELSRVYRRQPGEPLLAKARWYLLMCYVKENDRRQTLLFAEEVIEKDKDPIRVTNAKKIINRLHQ